ncbi:MAG: GMC family oxidoreductase [Sedimenticolaceae bacterium]
MFIDARRLHQDSRLSADLAIIGAGPAGITLARSMIGRATRVCLVEAGGTVIDGPTQALYEGENVGIEYPLAASRLRYFGGSSNHWGGYCRTLDLIDLEQRDWLPDSGWPFGIDELQRYYEAASVIVEVAPARYSDRLYWQEKTGEHLREMPSGRMDLAFIQFSPPTHFGQRYGDELKAAANIDVLLNANVTNIGATQDGQSVQRLDIATLNGLRHRVDAKTFIVATGALENPRLLLLSNDVLPAGLGNQHDLVGRYFMEHPHLSEIGEVVVADIDRLPKIYWRPLPVDGRNAHAAFVPSDAFLRQNRLLNIQFTLGYRSGYRKDRAPGCSDIRAKHLEMLAASSQLTGRGNPGSEDWLGAWLALGCACEQAPNPNSRVMLADERDVLGLRKIRLDWRLTETDRYSLVRHLANMAMEIGALGIGRMRIDLDDPEYWPPVVQGGSHHMGTTRMHDDPTRGVVDGNCKVHGIDNLYVAGGSIFPTSGAANPTLTIVALTLRLADHLKSKGI